MHTELQVRSFIHTSDIEWRDPGFHQHSSLEIEFVLEGRGLFEWRQGRLPLEMGHIVIIPAKTDHRFEAYGKNRYAVIHLEHVPSSISELLTKLSPEQDSPTFFTLSRLDKERFERLFREWIRIKASHLNEQARTYRAWMEVILLFLLEHSYKDQQSFTIAKAADYIRENLQEGVQISALAEMAGFSETGFRRLFEQVYHMSPKQYQQQCRMAEAKWLLSSSDKEMMEIALQIGFTRLHSFSQWFKQTEGVSPTEWRKLQHHG
ncbi:helix-turn-helix domain-containing protein [Paenibacillus sp. GCM10027626]|uniref:helix-turn-helix domain-containing protein n=1 Tax=Paenibacillus sp. GCM10027626 TaxID=3273411 RepID=UPI00363CBD16